jgi:3',5'-cyclic AMP phosphodiesterase CpdA
LIHLSIALVFSAISVTGEDFASDLFAPDATELRQHEGGVLRLVLVGDTGNPGTHLHEAIDGIAGKPIDAVLLLGDNFYPCGVRSDIDRRWKIFTDDLGEVHAPTFAILGNHDYGNPNRRGVRDRRCHDTQARSQVTSRRTPALWHMPARNYVIRTSVADIVMVDTNPLAQRWSAPYLGSATAAATQAWLERTLSASRSRWKIVAGHHPIYSSGTHGTTKGPSLPAMRALLPVLKANEVAVYAAGHDHHLELIGDRSSLPLFLVSGAGSSTQHYRERPKSEPPTLWKAPGRRSFEGFAVLTVTRRRILVEFYDEESKKHGEYTVDKAD